MDASDVSDLVKRVWYALNMRLINTGKVMSVNGFLIDLGFNLNRKLMI